MIIFFGFLLDFVFFLLFFDVFLFVVLQNKED